MTLTALSVGALGAVAPEPARGLRPDGDQKRIPPPASHRPPPDPGYAGGRPMQALRRPVHNLRDLRPDAPANAVALTIDDGPDPKWTPMVLDLLARFQVPATFCLIGLQVKEFPKLIQRMVAAGHQVADHTVTHPMDLPALSAGRIQEEIGEAHDRIAQTAGIAPRFFRAPGGAWSPQIMDTAAKHGMICIDWEVDTRDWARPGTQSITNALLGAKAGDILLCHDGGGDRSETVQALLTVIPALKARGLTFVAL
ncbi:MAG: polysaccharide deacetylase [Streptosporangiaceae bacterium]|jgi:peptidoglycan/xylan/chitin deacetylase (PgdA/CDA1 family)|nr:polysaccharide deacetylase [Streptosporangiaceae bacterium]